MEKIKVACLDADGWEVEKELPAKYAVCGRCEGRGTHTNPAVDGNGISPEEFAEDPEFQEDYLAGVYDIQCCECRGARVVLVLDRGRCDAETVKAYDEGLQALADYRAEEEAERRMGA